MIVHQLKCAPHYFAELQDGRKTFEVRDATDRCFQAGDQLCLQVNPLDDLAWANPMHRRGFVPQLMMEVIAVYAHVPGIDPRYVVMSVRKSVDPDQDFQDFQDHQQRLAAERNKP